MKLLIAHDGSSHSIAAIADLARCGLPRSGTVRVLSVADAWQAGAGDAAAAATADLAEPLRAQMHQARAVAGHGRELVAAQLPGWRVEAVVTVGSPAWEIIHAADEWKPDLVILGETGTGRLERIVFGTTTSQVVNHVRCSVRVSRPRAAPQGPVRIMIGADGSEPSMVAARAVAARAWPEGSEARIVVVLDGWLLQALNPDAAEADRSASIIADVTTALGGSGLAISHVTREGDPKAVLPAEALGWNADCIFIGPKGRSGVERLLLGSVAVATASRASCSVEIVRG